ncbi:MAG TPA: AI-2E family transporter [Pyrinomonadaceae bacterium]|nr:AI-2E family transporter [Pyrinomonadaceae bacterium]
MFFDKSLSLVRMVYAAHGWAMTRAARLSYFFILAVIVLAALSHLATPLVTVLFAYFALRKLSFGKRKWLSITLFVIVVLATLYGVGYLIRQALIALPKIASESIPLLIAYAQQHGIELPFTDLESLKATTMDALRDEFLFVGNFARAGTKQLVFILIGIVVAVSLFLNPRVETYEANPRKPNLFTALTDEIRNRFQLFYNSFETVMGAQIVISAINTLLTAVFVTAISLKHGTVVIGLTFLCGLLPIVGNLISNSIIVGIALTISPQRAIAALIFLVLLHKFEYFLNSKIIGDRIKNPVWLTLLALVIGERVMGIPGMILAPVVLHYIKVEMSLLPPPDEPVPTQPGL